MSSPDGHERITHLLRQWQSGDAGASEQLMSLLYPELMRLARSNMRRERRGHTLQATDLVHEAYLRLAGVHLEWDSRRHFLSAAAGVMRRVLVDHARRLGRQKRISPDLTVTLAEDVTVPWGGDGGIVALDEALTRLEELDPDLHRVLEWHFFGGLTYEEIGSELERSPATVGRQLRLGRAWLRSELEPG